VYEKALKDDCGYTGMAMYWDWVADSADITNAAVYNPVLGFGGNGVLNGTDNNGLPRVRDGAFTDMPLTYWGTDVRTHYLSRSWRTEDNLFANGYTPEAMEWVYNQTTYDGFRAQLENYPHAAVHVGVGGGFGDMGTQPASPNGEPFRMARHWTYC
jgi:tyrosinase